MDQGLTKGWLASESLTKSGGNLLHVLSHQGDKENLSKVIDKLHVNIRDYCGATPLYYAAESNSVETVKFLLEYHASPVIINYSTKKYPKDITNNSEIKDMLIKYENEIIPFDPNNHSKLKSNFNRYDAYRYKLYLRWLADANRYFVMINKDHYLAFDPKAGFLLSVLCIFPIQFKAQKIFEEKGYEGLKIQCQKLLDDFINNKTLDCCLYCSSKENLKRCSKCKEVWFCNAECQRDAFHIHKTDC